MKLDLEMAFANEESVMSTIEIVVKHLWHDMLHYELSSPFPRITYEEAMSSYGSDKPDRRLGMKVSAFAELQTYCILITLRYFKSANG